ncbi:MAG: radical SAM protein [Collinsella stercoris]|nr:radical SAM protein [Collinsella stercoris]
MEEIILDILAELRAGREVDDRTLLKLSHAAARREQADKRAFAKRRLLPFYQSVKREDPARWESWRVTPELEERLLKVLRMKPRRSASGVATITVITKPWPCGGSCLFCPNDIRMPKSYLHNEPACERAEQNWFDPYLQVSSRLNVLAQMGHATDKIELIVLGGTWSDYPQEYQVWFMAELFRALNDGAGAEAVAEERRAMYRSGGFPQSGDEFAAFAACEQDALHAGERTYNQAFRSLYGKDSVWGGAARWQRASWEELEAQQRENERARHRVVGLVIETRPDAVTPAALTTIRRLGCTKVQMGVQSLDQEVLDANGRGMDVARIQEAFELLRVFGFKIHAHAMANLFGSTPERDKRDYERLVRERPFQPDEIKLYPCALIEGALLCACYERGTWCPYSEDELLDVLVSDVAVTPAWTRISRMIRDFSSHDIVAGNKKPNLRQLVEMRLREQGETKGIQEIRFREVGTACVDMGELELDVVAYETSNTSERFLQWVTPDNRIAGFLRLSLPSAAYVRALGNAMGRGRVEGDAEEMRAEHAAGEAREKLEMHVDSLPIREGEAMIREVHVYGMATQLGADGTSAQHLGLGRRLVERACAIAREAGYGHVNVISAVGTREYYRHLGFCDHGLYQRKELL